MSFALLPSRKTFHIFTIFLSSIVSSMTTIHEQREREESVQSCWGIRQSFDVPLQWCSAVWMANDDEQDDATICNVGMSKQRNIYFTPNKFPIVYVFPCTFILFIPLTFCSEKKKTRTKRREKFCMLDRAKALKGARMWSTRTSGNSVQHRQQQQYFRAFAMCSRSRCVICSHWKWLKTVSAVQRCYCCVVPILFFLHSDPLLVCCARENREQESRKWNHIINFHYRLQHSKYTHSFSETLREKPLNLSIKFTHVHSWVESSLLCRRHRLTTPSSLSPPSTSFFSLFLLLFSSSSWLFCFTQQRHSSSLVA